MKRLLAATVALAALVVVTGTAAPSPTSQQYRGEYFYNFETAAFTPEGSSEAWCVDSGKLKDAELPADAKSGGAGGTADVVIIGVLSAEGHYCNLGAYKHFLDISKVVEIRNRKKR
ncbi:MAG TPA: hypothetical protein VFQ26_05990 [Nitrospiraceae bacterium]|nr:hypothetical protein [Nitrospiraceae bacterium]